MQCASSSEYGYLSIRDISLENQEDMIHLRSVMQEFPQGLLGKYEHTINFIIDTGASRVSTFDTRDLVLGSLKIV